MNSSPFYDIAGPEDAPVVLLVHGSVVSRISWQGQVKDLSSRYRVLVPDLPGHGVLRGEPFRFKRALDLLETMINREANGKAVLVGISLGGHLVTLLAERRPEITLGVVISGASMNFHGLTGGYLKLAAWMMNKLLQPDRLARQAEKNMRAKWPQEYVEAQLAAGIAPLGAAQSFEEISQYDFRASLAKVTAPVLILNGETDRPNRRSENHFASVLKYGQVKVVPGAGHACNIENPVEYNRLLMEFLDQCVHPAGKEK